MIYLLMFLAWLFLMFIFSLSIGVSIIEFILDNPVAGLIAFLMFALLILRKG